MIKIEKLISECEIENLILSFDLVWCPDINNIYKFCLQIFIEKKYCVVIYSPKNERLSDNFYYDTKFYKFNKGITQQIYNLKEEGVGGLSWDEDLYKACRINVKTISTFIVYLYKVNNLRCFE